MKKKRDEVIDDDGNIVPPPDPGSDVAKLVYLLEWGRKNQFLIGPTVQIGDVILQVRDLRLKARPDPDDKETDIWTEHGYTEEIK